MGAFDGDPVAMRRAALTLHSRHKMVQGMKSTRGYGDLDVKDDPSVHGIIHHPSHTV